MPLKEWATSEIGPGHAADSHIPRGCHGDLRISGQAILKKEFECLDVCKVEDQAADGWCGCYDLNPVRGFPFNS